MNKSLLLGTVLGVAVATAGGALATYTLVDKGPSYATVTAVEPIKETQRTPREVCRDVTLTHRRPVQDEHKIAGTVLGAVAGGLLGSQVGGGNGKKLATVAGAAAGGYAGNQVQGRMQANDTYTTTERRCETVTDVSEKVVGYQVRYDLDGKPGQVRMARKPGERIPVEDGQLVLDAPQG